MQVSQQICHVLAERIRDAYTSGTVAPLRDALEATDADGAYAVQSINTEFWRQQGRRVVGRKIGLTAKAVQLQLGVSQPDFGVLFDDMRIEDGGCVSVGRLIQPKVEAEVAVMLSKDLTDPDATLESVAGAIEYVIAAIEVVDSRIADWKISFADTVADNGSSGLFVLGSERRAPAGVDLYTCGMALEVNGALRSYGAGAACLGHPLASATWLARKLASLGQPLRAGDIVLTGALGPMVDLKLGDKVVAKIGGIGTASFQYGGQS